MADEKKEEVNKDIAVPAEAVKPEAAAPAPEVKAATAAPEVKAEVAAVKKEKPTNCASCKKSIKGKRWYYRNGQYYCTKRCWSTTKKPAQATEEATPAKA